MSSPSEKLAQSLEVLKQLQDTGTVAIQSKNLSRTHRQRLLKNGFLKEVMKGWYIPGHPREISGESTIWFASFWGFCAAYAKARYGSSWCISPEQSILLLAGNWNVVNQLVIRTPKANNTITKLLFETSILEVRHNMPKKDDITSIQGLNIFSVAAALVYCSPRTFIQYSTDVRTVLSLVKDPSEIIKVLLEGNHSTIAGRLAGAFRNIGNNMIADNIVQTMRSVDYDVREIDPFETISPILLNSREKSPYVNRMRVLWYEMRKDIIDIFPKPQFTKLNVKKYLKNIDDKYVLDAYHSLSIEGYNVSTELIEHVRSGKWNPDIDDGDREHKNALAARGYWQAFQMVRASIQKVLNGENSGMIANKDHRHWYTELFGPNVTAGILKLGDIAGYRNSQVYIRNSKYVPPNKDAVRDLMPEFFELLEKETEASVRIVLGHFFFVNIHPYMDGNGRIGRFLMNVMFASGRYPWVIIPVEQRQRYMQALEEASVRQNIVPFCIFISDMLKPFVNSDDSNSEE